MCLPDEKHQQEPPPPCSATKSISQSLTSPPLWCHSFIRFSVAMATWPLGPVHSPASASLSLLVRPSPSPDSSETSPLTPSVGYSYTPSHALHPPPFFSAITPPCLVWREEKEEGMKHKKGRRPGFTSWSAHALKSLWSNRHTFLFSAWPARQGRHNRAWVAFSLEIACLDVSQLSNLHTDTQKKTQHVMQPDAQMCL